MQISSDSVASHISHFTPALRKPDGDYFDKYGTKKAYRYGLSGIRRNCSPDTCLNFSKCAKEEQHTSQDHG
ncbi:hypothetical protein Y032_0357g3370 [Ancylostoma ceylanicum]|uniref:Uncharacterized protein n=1 Tax=Ancylostoma ceylanicum TaxID=53326 RepID=A0A016RW81_9BILA|nr:hypothetical protein Y032_0357g3370 [Ancylostoma ceylanicum]